MHLTMLIGLVALTAFAVASVILDEARRREKHAHRAELAPRPAPVLGDVARWIQSLPPEEAGYLHGVAFAHMASSLGVTEHDLYVEFACKAAQDPNCRVVH